MRRLVLLACALLVLAGCGGQAVHRPRSDASTPTASPGAPLYVALGDSYTAAPYVPLTDVADGCLRSDQNYPTRVSRTLGYRLVDVSCGGATSADLVRRQHTFGQTTVPPQLAALSPRARLVTLGIGGNDFGLFASLSRGCPLTGANRVFTPPPGTRCGHVDLVTADAQIARIGRVVQTDLAVIRKRAPRAVVVLVGYPRIAASNRSCPRLLPVRPADATALDGLTARLSAAMKAAARRSHVAFVDMYAASAGHDVCAGPRAWVNGIHTDTQRAAALHPFAAEQQAVATRITRLVGRG